MRAFLAIPALLLCLITTAQATRFAGGLSGNIGLSIPTGDFADHWGKNMFAAGGQLAFPFGRSPVQGGLAFDYNIMGSYDRKVPVNTNYLNITEGTLTTNCKAFSYHTFLRLSPFRGKIRPYVDAMAGFRQFSTTTKVTADGISDPVSKERNASDVTFSTGWAAGLQVGLGSLFYLEGRVERFNSGEATYVDPASVTISDQGVVGFSTLTSSTDVTNVLIGLGIRF